MGIEPLEARRLLAVFTVTNLNDAGDGSLRQAILNANAAPGADAIEFDAAAVGTIDLTSGELRVTDAIIINGPGPDALTIDANEQSRVFNINDGNSLSRIDVGIAGVTITGGRARRGGGILSREHLSVINSTISGNTARDGDGEDGYGGGIFAYSVTVTDSVISGNTARDEGGGIHASNVTVTNSTISGNTAGDGGGIYAYDVTVTNSTISGNTARGSGGGIYAEEEGDVTVTNSTISGNTARRGGGIYAEEDGNVTVTGSILSGNTTDGQVPEDAAGRFDFFDANHSLIGVAASALVTTGSDNTINDDPKLAPLADNGGPTKTHALLPGSPAIDAGDPDFAPPPEFDQREAPFDRVVNGRIDIGAYEFGASNAADLTGNGFVDFEDLTELLAAWNQNVSAAEGNLVDAALTPVNFEDLTVLLAAWTGPGGAASPPAAVAKATVSGVASFSTQDTTTAEGRLATSAHFDRLGRRNHATLRRTNRAGSLSVSPEAPLRRLQAAAIDRAMVEQSESTLVNRTSAFVRRRR